MMRHNKVITPNKAQAIARPVRAELSSLASPTCFEVFGAAGALWPAKDLCLKLLLCYMEYIGCFTNVIVVTIMQVQIV